MKDVFDALAHPVRREILKLLRTRPMSAGDIADKFDLSKPSLSGHFAVLKAAGLVTGKRKGTSIVYRLNLSVVEEAAAALIAIAGVGAPKKKRGRLWASAHR